MAHMSLDEFERYVISICSVSPAVKNVAIINSGLMWLNIRAYLTDESFVDIFYNQGTGRTTFAQIWEIAVSSAQITREAGTGIHVKIPTIIYRRNQKSLLRNSWRSWKLT